MKLVYVEIIKESYRELDVLHFGERRMCAVYKSDRIE